MLDRNAVTWGMTEWKPNNYLFPIDKRARPLIFSNYSVALVETCPQLLSVSSSVPQVKECTFLYLHKLGHLIMCDFGTAAWPQMMQTPTKKKFLKVVFIQRKLYLVTLAVLTLEF